MEKVEVTLPGETSDQNRLGSVLPRTRVVVADGDDEDVRSKGLDILLDLLDVYPTLDGAAPLIMQTYSVAG